MHAFKRKPGLHSLHSACAFVLALILGACAATGERRSSPGAIGYQTISEGSYANLTAHEIINHLRPEWLRPRGAVSLQSPNASYPVVYVNGTRYGPLDSLRQLPSDSIRQIEYMGASDATTRFGTGHPGGVIMITTR
jgi:hypothetical protein